MCVGHREIDDAQNPPKVGVTWSHPGSISRQDALKRRFNRILALPEGPHKGEMVMKTKKRFLLLAALLFIISSCSMLQIFSGAQYEFDQGLALFNRGSYESAITHFQRATVIDPNFAHAYLYLGRSYLSLNRWREAVPPLRTALRLSPDETQKEVLNFLVDALFGVAVADFKVGNFESSVDHFREIFELEPKSLRAKNGLARALITYGGDLLSKGDVLKAITAYSEGLKLSPNNLDATLGLARAHFRNGDILKSMQAVQDAIRIDPTNRDAQFLFRDLQGR